MANKVIFIGGGASNLIASILLKKKYPFLDVLLIEKNNQWFNEQPIFEKNYKFIDHAKINNRIVAQQGAFVLFQGNTFSKLPAYMLNGIIIPHKYKPQIRKELSLLFGINTGTIYPEIVNLAKDISQKSKMIVTDSFTWESELNFALNTLKKELLYYGDYLYHLYANKHKSNEFYTALQNIQIIVNSYRSGLIKFCNDYYMHKINICDDDSEEKIKRIIGQYNKIINGFILNIQEICDSSSIEKLIIENKN